MVRLLVLSAEVAFPITGLDCSAVWSPVLPQVSVRGFGLSLILHFGLSLLRHLDLEVFENFGVLLRLLHEVCHRHAYALISVGGDFEESECRGVLRLTDEIGEECLQRVLTFGNFTRSESFADFTSVILGVPSSLSPVQRLPARSHVSGDKHFFVILVLFHN